MALAEIIIPARGCLGIACGDRLEDFQMGLMILGTTESIWFLLARKAITLIAILFAIGLD